MARKCWIVYLRLWTIFVTICRVRSFDCQPTDCGCKDVSRGMVLDLTAIDKKLTVQNRTVADSSDQDGVLYYFHLCTPLQLPGNCNNSLVCERDMLAKTYTSFGRKGATSYSVFTQPPQIVMTIRDEARRSTVVSLIPGSSNAVKLVSANTTTLEFSVVVDDSLALPTHLILALGAFSAASTSSVVASSPPSASFSGPLTISSGAATFTQTHSITPTSSISPTPSPPHTSPFSNSAPTPSPPHTSPFSNSASFSSPSPSVTFTLSPSYSTSSSFHSSSSSSLFTSPSSPSPSPHPPPPHPSPSSTPCICTDSKNYALSLGIAVPVTAVTTFLLTLLMVFCCQRVVKRKRQYIRLAPTVYFDEEEHD